MVAAVEPFDFIASITSAYSRLGPIYYFSTNSALIGAAFVMGSLPSPSDGDQDRASALLAVYWVPFPFTFALICARIFVRCRTRSLGLDDYTMVLAWVLEPEIELDFSLANDILDSLHDFQCACFCRYITWRCSTHLLPESGSACICLQIHLHQLAVHLRGCRNWQV